MLALPLIAGVNHRGNRWQFRCAKLLAIRFQVVGSNGEANLTSPVLGES